MTIPYLCSMDRILEQYERRAVAERQVLGATSDTNQQEFNVRTISISMYIYQLLPQLLNELGACNAMHELVQFDPLQNSRHIIHV